MTEKKCVDVLIFYIVKIENTNTLIGSPDTPYTHTHTHTAPHNPLFNESKQFN